MSDTPAAAESEAHYQAARGEVEHLTRDAYGDSQMSDEPYWEISGPRKYLNIPTPVPAAWRAAVWVGPFGKGRLFVGWGATQDEAQAAARKAAKDAKQPPSRTIP